MISCTLFLAVTIRNAGASSAPPVQTDQRPYKVPKVVSDPKRIKMITDAAKRIRWTILCHRFGGKFEIKLRADNPTRFDFEVYSTRLPLSAWPYTEGVDPGGVAFRVPGKSSALSPCFSDNADVPVKLDGPPTNEGFTLDIIGINVGNSLDLVSGLGGS